MGARGFTLTLGAPPNARGGEDGVTEGIVWCVLAALCALGLGLGRRELEHPLAALLRVLFPSFRFFDDVAPLPTLYVRTGDGAALGPWQPALQAPPRRLRHALWNPEGNLHLAHGSLLERLISDLAEAGPIALAEAEGLTSYGMVLALAAQAADRLGLSGAEVQFKLDYGEPVEEVLVSQRYARRPRGAARP
jgi:hypothetical protein